MICIDMCVCVCERGGVEMETSGITAEWMWLAVSQQTGSLLVVDSVLLFLAVFAGNTWMSCKLHFYEQHL